MSFSVFGDASGVAVFLGALCVVGVTWRVGFFITDSYAVANALANLARGHLSVERLYYSLTIGSQPGLHLVDGTVYARNYGQVVLALPIYYALDFLTTLADLHMLLVTLWAAVFAAFCRQLGIVLGDRRHFQVVGSLLAAALVLGSIPLATGINADRVGIAALQILSLLAVATTALALYRLGSWSGGRRTGVAAAGTAVLATPMWFWAAIPKRHALTGATVAVLLFWFAVSREGSDTAVNLYAEATLSKALLLRAAGYVLVGLLSWMHAFEGIVLLGAFAVADLATASSTSRRALAALGVAAALGFTPFFATNLAVSGDPFEPPRLTPSVEVGEEVTLGPNAAVVVSDDRLGSTGSGTDGGPSAMRSTEPPDNEGATADESTGDDSLSVSPLVGIYRQATGFSGVILAFGDRIASAVDSAPSRLYHTYLRSGRIPEFVRYGVNDQETVELSLLESAPLFGGFAGTIAVGVGRLRLWRRTSDRSVRRRVRASLGWFGCTSPERRTDVFAAGIFVAFAVTYFPLLPLHSQITVRYLLPTIPALVYLLVRLPPVADAVASEFRTLVGSYAASVLVGGLAVAVAVPRLEPAVGEAMQLHALANLAAAAVVAVCLVAPLDRIGIADRARALSLGLAAAATTVLVAFMQLAYFEYGTYAVPLVRLVADAVRVLS